MSIQNKPAAPQQVGENSETCETCDRIHIGDGKYHCNDCHTTIRVDQTPDDNMFGSTAEPTNQFSK
jgi:uncharacterized paraquat-inducible protein A